MFQGSMNIVSLIIGVAAILAEKLVAKEMKAAARTYQEDPIALQLRAMNMTYESIKAKGALMVIPSGMADSINPGVVGLASLGFQGSPFSAASSEEAK